MEKDRLIDEIERNLGIAAGDRAADAAPTRDDEPDDPYEEALAALRSAAQEFERAGHAAASAERQLSLYPAPVLRPVLRLAQFAAIAGCAAAHPLTAAGDWRLAALPGLVAFAAAAAGETAGAGIAAFARGRGFPSAAGAALLTLAGAAAGSAAVAVAGFFPLPAAASWFGAAVAALFLCSGATLPFLPTRGTEQARLEDRARAARARQAKAFGTAQDASERLERIHAGHLAARPAAGSAWRRIPNEK